MVQNTCLVSKMQADQWYRQLLRSHEMMQQVVGGADPASPLEVDWDTASATSTDQPEDERGSGMLCRLVFYLPCNHQMPNYRQKIARALDASACQMSMTYPMRLRCTCCSNASSLQATAEGDSSCFSPIH